jgi:hypothetical protein
VGKFRRRYFIQDLEKGGVVEVGKAYVLFPAQNPADLAALHTLAENLEPEMAADIREHIKLIEGHPDRTLGSYGTECLPHITHEKVKDFAALRLARLSKDASNT